MNRPPLAILVDAQAAVFGELVALLEREQQLLIAADVEGLQQLAQEKNDCHRELQRLHEESAGLFARSGRAYGDASMREVCATLPGVLPRWEETLAAARRARELNALNGTLILERMANNQALLSLLLDASRHLQLYDAAGQSKPNLGGRIIGLA